jgi:hypothetical protein
MFDTFLLPTSPAPILRPDALRFEKSTTTPGVVAILSFFFDALCSRFHAATAARHSLHRHPPLLYPLFVPCSTLYLLKEHRQQSVIRQPS